MIKLAVSLALLFLCVSCTVYDPDDIRVEQPDTAPTEQSRNEADDGSSVIDAVIVAPLDLKNRIPTSVVIKLKAPKVITDKTIQPRYEVTPHVNSVAERLDNETLAIRFKTPLKGQTQYSVHLKDLTVDGVAHGLRMASQIAFTTPAFQITEASRLKVNYNTGTLSMRVLFNRNLDLDTLVKRGKWLIDGTDVSDSVSLRYGSTPGLFLADIQSEALTANSKLTYVFNSNRRLIGELENERSFSQELDFSTGPTVQIKGIRPREGTQGFVIDIACDDPSAGGRRSFWSSHFGAYLKVSDRCQISQEQLLRHVKIIPSLGLRASGWRGGIRLTGPFKAGAYQLSISDGLQSLDGGRFSSADRIQIQIPRRKPKLTFISNGRYLPRTAVGRLPLQHINLSEAELTIRHIPKANLVHWLTSRSERATYRTSALQKQTTIKLLNKPDQMITTLFDLKEHLPEVDAGVYELEFTSRAAIERVRLLLTDLNVVVKRSPKSHEAEVYVLDTHSNRPQSGADVRLIYENGLTAARCRTNAQGHCKVTPKPQKTSQREPFAILVSRGSDFTYLKYSDVLTVQPDAATFGSAYKTNDGYLASIYTDRGAYRPGETIPIAAIVRTNKQTAPAKPMPIELKITDPSARVVVRQTRRTNTAGMVEGAYTLPLQTDTGRYTITLEVADKTIASQSILVQTFVPERMKVSVKASAKRVIGADEPQFQIKAQYLFGGSAKGSKVEFECRFKQTPINLPGWNGYHFGVGGGPSSDTAILAKTEVILDERGQVMVKCPTPMALKDGFSAGDITAHASVFEAASGRTSKAAGSTKWQRSPLTIGLYSSANSIESGKTVSVKAVVLGPDGKPVSTLDKAAIETIVGVGQYGRYMDQSTGRMTWQRIMNRQTEGTVQVKPGTGVFSFEVTPNQPGDLFIIRVSAGGATAELTMTGEYESHDWSEAYDNYGYRDRTDAPERATSIHIKAPMAISAHETFSISYRAPYLGRALITIETDQLLHSKWVDAKPGQNHVTLKAPEFQPNIYVSVFLSKAPRLDSTREHVPKRAVGTLSIPMDPHDFNQPIALTVPKEIRPNSDLSVAIKLQPSDKARYVTLAAVDEGVLSLTRFKTPSPLTDLLARRRLGVTTYDTIGWSLRLASGTPALQTGGDGEGDNKPPVKAIKPVALWSGLYEVPKSGELTITLPVPQYQGRLKVMAVAAGPKRVGTAAASVLVKDPLALHITSPRGLSYGDVFTVPVFITNTTTEKRSVLINLSQQRIGAVGKQAGISPLSFVDSDSRVITLKAHESGRALFTLKTNLRRGAVTLQAVAKSGTLMSRTSNDIPIDSNWLKGRDAQSFKLDTEQTLPVNERLRDLFEADDHGVEINVSTKEYSHIYEHLSYLLTYPFGCLEQTTSGTRPLLFTHQHGAQLHGQMLARRGGVNQMVKAGIDRVLSMQTPSGGLGYWPGALTAHPWGTAYATHMLQDAIDVGHPVDSERLKKIFDWMESALKGDATQLGLSTQAYFHYLLARANRLQIGKAKALLDTVSSIESSDATEARLLLMAALHSARAEDHTDGLRQLAQSASPQPDSASRTFYSPTRADGMKASILISLLGRDPVIKPILDALAARLARQSDRYTTQDLAWAVTAIGIWDQQQDLKPPQVRLLADGHIIEPTLRQTNDGLQWRLPSWNPVSGLVLENIGDTPIQVTLVQSGTKKADTLDFEDHSVSIRRQWLTHDGAAIDPAKIELGDVIYAKLELSNQTDRPLNNLALVDRFPPGWEIESASNAEALGADWHHPEKQWAYEHMNQRDASIEVFGSIAAKGQVTLVYALRAVTSGTFTLPTADLVAMYQPDVWSRTQGGTTVIRGPWAEKP